MAQMESLFKAKGGDTLNVLIQMATWATKARVCILVLGVIFYYYMLYSLKYANLRGQKLDQIEAMIKDTEKMLQNIQRLDQLLAEELQQNQDQ